LTRVQPVLLLAGRRQVLLAALAAQVQQRAVRPQVAQAELVETRMVAQELQVAHQEVAAVQTAVRVLLAETAAMSSQEMAEMQKVIRAAQAEIAEPLYSLVAAEDQVLTVSRPAVRK
jgi:hypothetical protein